MRADLALLHYQTNFMAVANYIFAPVTLCDFGNLRVSFHCHGGHAIISSTWCHTSNLPTTQHKRCDKFEVEAYIPHQQKWGRIVHRFGGAAVSLTPTRALLVVESWTGVLIVKVDGAFCFPPILALCLTGSLCRDPKRTGPKVSDIGRLWPCTGENSPGDGYLYRAGI